MFHYRWPATLFAVAGLLTFAALASAQGGRGRGGVPAVTGPWSDKTLSPDQRADLVIAAMTLDEKIQLLHGGPGGMGGGPAVMPAGITTRSNGGAGWVPGIPRLGIPDVNMADSAVGVTRGDTESRYSTLLPSSLGAAASWNADLALLYGQVIGRELRDQGYNMSIGGGVDITREARNGRNFEYAGEDPILAGITVGNLMKGMQSQQVMGDIKHYALNDQETGRNTANALIDKRSMRETDLLAFQIAYKISDAAGFMCSYNLVNGDWACENDYLLNQVLKKDFGFKGWVLSDWGGTHSTKKAIMAGLDQEQPGSGFFGDALKAAVQSGDVPLAKVNDSVHRILRSMFAVGVWDNPPQHRVVDPFKGREDARKIAEESIVLLKNANNQLPLSAALIKSIAIIGSHADVGVPSGGGSAQVLPPGGNAAPPAPAADAQGGGGGFGGRGGSQYFPSSPMKFIQAKAPKAKVEFNQGMDLAAAAALAKASQVAIVFVNQPMSEGSDASTLTLPAKQDDLVNAVVAANPHTIVVLETGGPVSMPWSDKVSGIMEAWFPGIGGGEAIANILFGDVNPSAKLPVTFAKSDADLPHLTINGPAQGAGRGGAAGGAGRGGAALTPEQTQAMQQQQAQQAVTQALQQTTQASEALIQAEQRLAQAQQQAAGATQPAAAEAAAQAVHAALLALQAAQPPAAAAGRGGAGGGGRGTPFDVPYTEKLQVGYKWFDQQNKEPLFPFGAGLSYTTYAYSGLKAIASGHNVSVSVAVKNTGKRAGKEIVQVYATLPASTGEPPKRLIGWEKVQLNPGESKTVNLTIDPLYLSIFNESKDGFEMAGGDYKIWAGASSRNLPLSETVKID
jgi:beta-glucosidase